MTDDAPCCVRCGRPVLVNREWYDVFERMHFLCFHMEFEHGDHYPDQGCHVPGCPVAETHANYLRDVGAELHDQALAARKYARENRDDTFAKASRMVTTASCRSCSSKPTRSDRRQSSSSMG